ncbi:MAG TPA: pantoate--beta-alanine ligase [Chthoniobacterales bacterium]|nr:pantoate--beta-alanine ligase [Chthoniobacterales bacterium]
MKIVESIAEAKRKIETGARRRVLVPTMGALHRGHVELLRRAREAAGPDGEVIVSIFVNLLQFEPGSDFEKYPRLEGADEEVCLQAGVDTIFRPTGAEMYAPNRSVFVDETALSTVLCGQSRPGHFRGVCTVVTKLFHVLNPDAAVFGEKDFQQLAIIRRMVRDLDFPIDIIGVPTVREDDGLACSSRNQYLNAAERKQAPALRAALLAGRDAVQAGERSTERVVESVRRRVESASLTRIDYVAAVDAQDLQPRNTIEQNALIALAVFFGQTRLIDNIRLP